MQVKFISSYDWRTFESEINKFIKDKKVIDIKYSSSFVNKEFKIIKRVVIPIKTEMLYSALIMYVEKEEFVYDYEELKEYAIKSFCTK